MSGIVGMFHRDGQAVDSHLLDRMTAAVSHRGPDAGGQWVDGSIGLGRRLFQTTPESRAEKQPLEDADRGLVLSLDGRIDNRETLTDSLLAAGYRLRDGTDAELVLRSYDAWRDQCASRLVGDFAFAIWDGRRKRLYCARDFYGSRPFYYCHDGRTFLLASELHALFEIPSVSQKPNEGMIGEYLHGYIRNLSETLFENILRLPAAHYLVADANGLHLQRYWGEDLSYSIRYRRDEEYAEHFLELLWEALRSRMRCIGTLGSDLSGGLDSSSIVCFSRRLLREGSVSCEGFEAFSQVYPGKDCDESDYIRAVVSECGVVAHAIEPQPVSLEFLVEQARFYKDFPGYPNGAIANPLRPMMRARGCRAILTGQGGDEWLSGASSHSLDSVRSFLRSFLWPRMPGGFKRGVRVALNRPVIPRWIGEEFARRIGLAERLDAAAFRPRRAKVSQQELHSTLVNGWNAQAIDLEDRGMAWHGLERRMPLFDRRIAEFGLAIPEEQRYRDGLHKYVLRQAMRGILPESVRTRADKAEFSWLFVNQFRALGGASLFDQLEIAKKGWVKLDEIRAMYHQIEDDSAIRLHNSWSYTWRLWMIWGIELWWRTVFGKST